MGKGGWEVHVVQKKGGECEVLENRQVCMYVCLYVCMHVRQPSLHPQHPA